MRVNDINLVYFFAVSSIRDLTEDESFSTFVSIDYCFETAGEIEVTWRRVASLRHNDI